MPRSLVSYQLPLISPTGDAHARPLQRQHLPVARALAHAALRRHAVGLGINHSIWSGGLHEIIGCASGARSAAARNAARARPARAAAAAGRHSASGHPAVYRPSQRKDFSSSLCFARARCCWSRCFRCRCLLPYKRCRHNAAHLPSWERGTWLSRYVASVTLRAAHGCCVRAIDQVYPGLASPLMGGADANTLQVTALANCLLWLPVVSLSSRIVNWPVPPSLQALLLLEQRGFVSQVGGGWQLCAASSLWSSDS